MAALIDKMRAPHAPAWTDKIGTADRLLYRRGNFSGTMDQLICDALRGELDAEIALSPGFRWGTTALAGQPLTMEDVLAQTATTYPATYVQSMTGGQIKDILEDVCDNLFNSDPYYQQGGDMVRTGGLAYTCTPTESVGQRISELKLENGHKLEAGKHYKVAGWASVNEQNGEPVWDVVAKHLRSGKPPNRQPRRHHQGRRRQSGHRGTGMSSAFRHIFARAIAALLLTAALGRAQQVPLQDKPFAEHKIVLQLSENDPKKQGLVISRRQQPHEVLRPRQGRDRGGGVRPRHRPAEARTIRTARRSRAWWRRACASTSASTPSIRWSARPASGRNSCRSQRRCRSASRKSCILTENGYTLVKP